eukprot:TRINITY_DN7899_c0_g2_i4.p1 TRINITY_DN7899_c0_g2~~TRINITY_DN7899_c0_g2_i4.p1  ORF type:complete len:390 (-),score=65.92 TRINITY_DN7899_c0_g2_i4:142-1311(-)
MTRSFRYRMKMKIPVHFLENFPNAKKNLYSPSPGIRVPVGDYVAGSSKKGNGTNPTKRKNSDYFSTREGIDGKTAHVLNNLQASDLIRTLGGTVSQGKEAFVYVATGGTSPEVLEGNTYAVKIFKKNKSMYHKREIYLNGIWQRGSLSEVKINSHKFISLWAEKEFRNLKKLSECGIPVPTPILVRNNVVVMNFIGSSEGWASPRLIDCVGHLDISLLEQLYWQSVSILKRMYMFAKLIHTDFTAHNLLVEDKCLVLIDMAQAVTIDHQYATHFLRRDCYNITKFFAGKGVTTLKTRSLYNFVSVRDFPNTCRASVECFSDLAYELNLLKIEALMSSGEDIQGDLVEENVWLSLELPKFLKDVHDPISVCSDSVYHSTIKSLNLEKQSS